MLTGCNGKAAETAAPGRPVLVATVQYKPESPERSFVGTIKPRIETDMGFRVPGKVAKRLVEVGQTVEVGQPLAALDEVDLKLQAEQAEAEFRAATGVLAQATASEQRAKDLRGKGWTTEAQMDQSRAAADEARARFNRAERSVELTKNSLSYAIRTTGHYRRCRVHHRYVKAVTRRAVAHRVVRRARHRRRAQGERLLPDAGAQVGPLVTPTASVAVHFVLSLTHETTAPVGPVASTPVMSAPQATTGAVVSTTVTSKLS